MERYFNITGSCNPQEHYMVNLDGRLAEIKENVTAVYSAPTATLARSNSRSVPTEPHYHKIVHLLTKFHKHSLLNLTFCGENVPIKGEFP